ncbi:Elongation factor-like GTPase 1 [Holothuria leucospilota]|uniref:Elongation factor-like 1 n=1 Tax=Holothuria leucospilota TaxID=206669 RepID=A0A9Q1BMM4_HOLLE|nr:Elongation factor-like GTPase 1 [Holothuria leucospilota]
MRFVEKNKLVELQKKPSHIRNICILAHVDHGKTTLADSFISSNGIISSRMAGQLRYMDSREDEQLRGITMKSSAIALGFTKDNEEFLINLIDTPGHVDFSSEVSTAVRLCDGALVVVDVVEGVSPQTHVVLHQAWLEDIKPCLVFNKIDRLITELKFTPLEAYLHLQQLLEQVNAVMGNLFASDILEQTATKDGQSEKDYSEKHHQLENQTFDWSSGLEDIDDSNIYFSPEEGNVIFASALDGWGFGIEQFADQYSKKLGVCKVALTKTLWGDFYLNSKTMRVMKGAQAKGKKPLFVQFVLENLWAVYDAVVGRRDESKMEKIIKSLNLKLGPRDLKQKDTKQQLKAILNKWLPVTTCALNMVCSKLPSPIAMSDKRIEKLLCSSGKRFDSLPEESQNLKSDFQKVQSNPDVPVVAFISKMFAVDKKSLPENKQRPLTAEEIAERRLEVRRLHAERQRQIQTEATSSQQGEQSESSTENEIEENGLDGDKEEVGKDETEEQVFIAFARIFSGVVKRGQKLYVMEPAYDPHQGISQVQGDDSSSEWKEHVHEVTVGDLYLLMGRDLENVEEVPAGNVFGIGGLEDIVYKSGTISSTLACPAFTDMNFAAKPIIRVAVEPRHLRDMPILINGMKLLNQADSSVEVFIQETGEHVLVAAGEVHLGKCLKDLRERFAQIELDVSVPIVPFRETIIPPPKVDMVNEIIGDVNMIQIPKQFMEEFQTEGVTVTKEGSVELMTSNKLHKFCLRALPLPPTVTSLLEENVEILQILDSQSTAMLTGKLEQAKLQCLNEKTIAKLENLKKALTAAFDESGKKWKGLCDKIWAFGPRRCGPNILVNKVPGYARPSIWDCLRHAEDTDISKVWNFDSCVVGGFQLVTLSGPMCDEPMMGVCIVVESWEFEGKEIQSSGVDKYAQMKHFDERKGRDKSGAIDETVLTLSQENSNQQRDKLKEVCDVEKEAEDIQGYKIISDVEQNDGTVKKKEPELLTLDIQERSGRDVNHGSNSPSMQKKGRASRNESYTAQQVYGPTSGQIISTVKEGCRAAFQTQPQRLMAAMYKCNIQATADVLGPLYSVISKRCGRVLQEEMREGSAIFDILATLPVAESFGFSEEIRKKTSGLASPQLFFSHWEVVQGDPYWVPSTEEELLHFGEKADSGNQARTYLDGVRRRKGLHVREHIVEHAEKQRTLSKNK